MTASFYPLHRPRLAPDLQAGEHALAALLAKQTCEFKARRGIAGSDQEPKKVYRIESGWCARIRYVRDGRAQMIAILLPGDLLLVEALFYTEQLTDVVTITDCVLQVADHERLADAARQDSALMLRLSWQMVEDVRRLNNWLVALSRGSAEERLALLLLDIRGRLVLARQLAEDAATMPWHLTQNETAQALGLTPVHVNRTWRKFRERGIADFGRHEAEVDVGALHRTAIHMLDQFERGSPAFGGAAGRNPASQADAGFLR